MTRAEVCRLEFFGDAETGKYWWEAQLVTEQGLKTIRRIEFSGDNQPAGWVGRLYKRLGFGTYTVGINDKVNSSYDELLEILVQDGWEPVKSENIFATKVRQLTREVTDD